MNKNLTNNCTSFRFIENKTTLVVIYKTLKFVILLSCSRSSEIMRSTLLSNGTIERDRE